VFDLRRPPWRQGSAYAGRFECSEIAHGLGTVADGSGAQASRARPGSPTAAIAVMSTPNVTWREFDERRSGKGQRPDTPRACGPRWKNKVVRPRCSTRCSGDDTSPMVQPAGPCQPPTLFCVSERLDPWTGRHQRIDELPEGRPAPHLLRATADPDGAGRRRSQGNRIARHVSKLGLRSDRGRHRGIEIRDLNL
jgi:hypothetical protein